MYKQMFVVKKFVGVIFTNSPNFIFYLGVL